MDLPDIVVVLAMRTIYREIALTAAMSGA